MIAGETPGYQRCDVSCNGVQLERCYDADSTAGVAHCYGADRNGRIIWGAANGMMEITYHGTITFAFADPRDEAMARAWQDDPHAA